MKKYLMLLISLVSSGLAFTQTTYVPVDAGSSVHFVIKNFGVKTGGDFKGLKGVIKFDPASLATSFFDVTVDVNTINTDNNMRDDHLKESEYFDVAKYKTIKIFGIEHEVKADIEIIDSYSAHGDYKEMIHYYECQDKTKVKQVFLVHGEYEVQLNYKEKLIAAGFKNITIPAQGDTIDLT